MSEIGIRALKQNASAVVAGVEAGEAVTVTRRGRPVARLVPMPCSRMADLIATGQARLPTRHWQDMPEPAPPRPGQPSLSATLEQMRQAERY